MGRRVVASLFAVVACGPVVGADDDTSTTGGSAATIDSSTTSSSPTGDPTSPTSLSTSGDPTSAPTDPSGPHGTDPTGPGTISTTDDPSDTTSADTCGFLCPFDVIIEPLFCDVWAQDCLRGEKCMPWANDGGTHWNDMRCTALDPTPAQPGDACTVQGSPVSGVDDCDGGSMCFFVDPDTNQGTCVAFCMGNEDDHLCEDPAAACAIELGGVLPLCLPACDPLLQDCTDGGCYPTGDTDFVCAPTFGIGLGAGQPCGHAWECAPGYTCYDGAHVPDCAGDFCCAPFCDITVPGQCEGLTCEPWFMQGQAPGLEPPIGVCIVE